MSDHPSAQELFEAAAHNATNATDRHLATCVRCQVLMSRLRQGPLSEAEPSSATLQVLRGSSPTVRVDTIKRVPEPMGPVEPVAGDVWRTQAPALLLVWVRRVVDHETVEVIPLTLDPQIADDSSLVVREEDTPWACEGVLLVDHRTHVHVGALAQKVGVIDATVDVQLILSGAEPSAGRVGPPILSINDQRVEYRDTLRSSLSSFAPSVWVEAHPATPDYWDLSREALSLRLDGISFIEWRGYPRGVAPGIELVPCVKCAYLGSTVLVCRLSDPSFLSDTQRVVDACRDMIAGEDDADAVAVFAADEDQDAIVVRRVDMRSAIGLPSGGHIGPRPYLRDLPLVDILFKHFDRYAYSLSWSVSGGMQEVQPPDIGLLASEHVRISARSVEAKGRAAHQPAKKAGYNAAAQDLDVVESFVRQAARGDVEAAIQSLIEVEER